MTATGEYGGPKGAYAGAEPTRYGMHTMQSNCYSINHLPSVTVLELQCESKQLPSLTP